MNVKHKRFADEYLIDRNGKQAAIRAGYAETRAEVTGSELLAREDVRAYIDAKTEKTAAKLDLSKERLLAEYAKIAFFDIRKIYDDGGKLLNLQDFDDDSAGAVAGLETIEEDIRAGEETLGTRKLHKVKISDKRGALDSICKIMGYNAPVKMEGKIEGFDIIIGGKQPDQD